MVLTMGNPAVRADLTVADVQLARGEALAGTAGDSAADSLKQSILGNYSEHNTSRQSPEISKLNTARLKNKPFS